MVYCHVKGSNTLSEKFRHTVTWKPVDPNIMATWEFCAADGKNVVGCNRSTFAYLSDS